MKFRILIAFFFIVGLVWSQNDVTPPIDTFPKDSIPEDSVSLDSLPLGSIPVDTLPKDTFPVDTASLIEIVNIENPAVRAYMADSTYFYDSDYNTSVVLYYSNSSSLKASRDLPNGKIVNWTPTVPDSLISEIRILLSEKDDFSDCLYYKTTHDATSYTISNMLPNKKYYYKVEEIHKDASASETARGVFRTVGQVRMINVDGCHNVRDMGGWITQFGTRIRYGKLYRSGNLDRVTSWGINDFKKNLNVTAELDLRGSSQIYSTLGLDVKYINYINGYYLKGLFNYEDTYLEEFNWIVECLHEGRNIDWHCQIGCDRCGTFSFLIGGLLGMTEVDLCRDYEMSSFSGQARPRSFDGNDSGTFASLIPYIKIFGPEDDLAQCFYNYFIGIGVQPENIEYFRSEMLEEIPVETESKQVITPMTPTGTTPKCFQSPLRIYSVNGMRQPCLKEGINIVVSEDGTASKYYIK